MLYKLGLFTDVRIEGTDRYDHRRDVHINVVEGNAGVVDVGIGYSTLEKITGFIDIGYKNLFGMNRQISLRSCITPSKSYTPSVTMNPGLSKGTFISEDRDSIRRRMRRT